MTDIPPIFAECCGDNTRHARNAPFQREGYLCATDGRICVRMVQEGDDTADTPKQSGLSWPSDVHEYDSEATVLPEVTIAERTVCETCGGKRQARCQECAGTGEECFECGHYGDCTACHGNGKRECEDCGEDGTTKPEVKTVEVAPGYGLADKYVALLCRHDAKVFLPKGRASNPVYFTVQGGIEGLLMPKMLAENE